MVGRRHIYQGVYTGIYQVVYTRVYPGGYNQGVPRWCITRVYGMPRGIPRVYGMPQVYTTGCTSRVYQPGCTSRVYLPGCAYQGVPTRVYLRVRKRGAMRRREGPILLRKREKQRCAESSLLLCSSLKTGPGPREGLFSSQVNIPVSLLGLFFRLPSAGFNRV